MQLRYGKLGKKPSDGLIAGFRVPLVWRDLPDSERVRTRWLSVPHWTWNVGQDGALDFPSPKYADLDSILSYCWLKGFQVRNLLMCTSSDMKKDAFSVHWTFEILMMLESYILDKNQCSVSLATGSDWQRDVNSCFRVVRYFLFCPPYMPCSLCFYQFQLPSSVQESFIRKSCLLFTASRGLLNES